MVKILIHGCGGHMGQVVSRMAEEDAQLQTVAGVDPFPGEGHPYPVYRSLKDYQENAPEKADVIVDFSSAKAVDELLSFCEETKTACVLCTTGLSPAQQAAVEEASAQIPVFQSANMSLGVAVLARAARLAAKLLPPGCDIEIIEKHHRGKRDAPSGTALQLAHAVGGAFPPAALLFGRGPASGPRGREIGIHAVRGGGIVGEHEILFCCEHETLSFSHSALSRIGFAQGALAAAAWLTRQNHGLYTMEDMLDDIQEFKKTP